MVGTVQADSFHVFIRKIGYSVGVESIFQRSLDFARAYASVASFKESDWDQLVQEVWKLKSPNVADVFNALGIALIQNREIYPGPIGEALGILQKLHPQGVPKDAHRLAIATAIVRSDGDIFLNALRSTFDEDATGLALVRMVQAKRELLFRSFGSHRDREAVARAVSIERQRSNRGSAGGGGLSSIIRGAPLGVRAQGLGLPRKTDVYEVQSPSTDYLRKVTVSRKGWAESLGLFADGQLTDAGEKFLLQLGKAGFVGPDGAFLVWPTEFEIESNQFQLGSFAHLNLPTTWEQQLAVYRALGGAEDLVAPDLEVLARRVTRVFDAYRQLSQHRSMIRNEMSSSIVTLVLLCEDLTGAFPAPDLSGVWDDPSWSDFGIAVRPSRTIEFAISVRPDAR